jgi:diguanylate cyclase
MRQHCLRTCSFVEVILHAALAVMVVGWNAGFQYYLFCIIPVVLVSPKANSRSKIILTMLVAFGYWYAEKLSGLLSPEGQHIPVNELHAMNVFLAFFCIMIISFYIQFITSENERKMMSINRMLGELADTDPLTGLMNRRSMQILLDSLFKNAKRDGLPLTILMMDLDRFKSVNDHYGHAAGDAVLVETATRLKHALRDNDSIARWGGEEFLVALQCVSLEQAAVVAEKLSFSVRNDAIIIGGKPTWMTITIGMACITPEDTLQDLIERADTQLYKGKKSGRNCIVS